MGDTVSKVGVLPPKGSRSFGVSANVAHEHAGEIFDGREYSTSDDLSFDTRKPDFDLIQTGRISGCEVQLDARMRFEESCHLGGFVGGEIVGNYMDLLARSTKGHHLVEEGDERVPCRKYSNPCRSALPGDRGNTGSSRSRACIADFSSTQKTAACVGGFRYKPMIAAAFFSKSGSSLAL